MTNYEEILCIVSSGKIIFNPLICGKKSNKPAFFQKKDWPVFIFKNSFVFFLTTASSDKLAA